MAGRGELTDEAWGRIEPLLPRNGRRGKQWTDHRQVINGILWRLRTGAPWRDVPDRYGPWQTCYDRFARWSRDVGTTARMLTGGTYKPSPMQWARYGGPLSIVSVDSTTARAHQHAAGARSSFGKGDKRGDPES